ncbi:MAG: ABC transporter ATP-binding protein [Candidatus Woesearchaeota archaeon]
MEESSIKSFIKTIIKLLPDFKKLFIFFLIFTIIYEAIKFIPPYLVKLIIDNLIESPDQNYLFLLVGLILLTLVIMTVMHVFVLTRVVKGATTQQKSLLYRSFKKLLRLPLNWHEKQNTGSLISKLQKASKYVQELVWFVNNDILPSIVQLVLTGAILFWVDWRLGLIFLIFTPIILYTVDRQFRKVQPLRESYHQAYESATNTFAQSLYNIKTVKDYVQEEKEEREHLKDLERYQESVYKRIDYEFWQISFRDTLTNIVRAITMAISIKLVLDGVITPGDLVFVFTIVEKAYINLHRLGRVYSFMGDTYESLNRAKKIQETENELLDNGNKKPKQPIIKFEDVSFSYGNEAVINKISLLIPNNKTTALVGPSGSGKTTIVKLIMRHYDVDSGSIKIDGLDIRDVSLNELRRNIAFVSQHTEMFDRTIKENIGYSKKKANKREIIAAAKKANAHKFIMSFKDGYDTIVGERGVRLSGGQQQRISIARALLSNAKIIVFDEATSSLDSESEKEIQSALLKIKNKTVIIIAHRFSTIEHSDNIIVLKDGKVVEQGSHENLSKKKGGLYKKMRELQKLGEIRD